MTMAILSAGEKVVLLLLFIAVLLSSISVIYTTHRSRQLFAESQRLNRESLALEQDWGRLLLEQSTWAAPDRVRDVASKSLKMIAPPVEAIRVIAYEK